MTKSLADESPGSTDSRTGHPETTILYCLYVVWRARIAISVFAGSAVLATMINCLVTPKIFESTATMMTQREQSRGGLLPGLMASAGVLQSIPGLGVGSLSTDLDLFVTVLRSRSVAEAVVKKFDLQTRYEKQHLADAVRKLRGCVSVDVSKEGLIGVTVSETDADLASNIANFYVEELERRLTLFSSSKAARKRKFIKERLAKTHEELRKSEEALREFQQVHRAFALNEQAKGVIDTAAFIHAQLISTQVRLESLLPFAADENPDVVALRAQLGELRRQMADIQLETQSSAADIVPVFAKVSGIDQDSSEAGVPGDARFAEYPHISLQLVRLTRDVKIQNGVYTLLTQQLEETKIEEASDIPSMLVLDRAQPAVRKSRPLIKRSMLLVGFASVFLGAIVTLAWQQVRVARQRWHEFSADLESARKGS
jgi:tyrosine-protein kinase Etk/Wzc